MKFSLYHLTSVLLLIISCVAHGQSVADTTWPHALAPNVAIRPLMKTEPNPVRIAKEPHTGKLVYSDASGNIYRIHTKLDSAWGERLYTAADHGIASVTGMAFGPDGTIFLVGNDRVDEVYNVATIRRGRLLPGDSTKRSWSTVARTAPYPRSNTNYDHTFNGIVVSPDGRSLFINSGSRTDHGELQTTGDRFPGAREVPLTSAILTVPADSTDWTLANDGSILVDTDILFADGTRNSFDLAFAPNGDLFGAENSGDRDDNEELNWLRKGRHYGFPWRMGTNNTPQQYPGYDPANDLLVNKDSYGSKGGFYYNDPGYPAPPSGVVFTDPIPNLGPDAVKYRDPATGAILSATAAKPLGTFTAHRSPLGLVFDVDGAMPNEYRGDGFITSWTDGRAGGSELLVPFNEAGQDLLHLELEKSDSGYVARTTRIAEGFNQPIDAEIVGNRIYILEFGGANLIWEVEISQPIGIEPPYFQTPRAPYPNPFSERTELVVDFTRGEHVTVELFDLLGRLTRTIYDDAIPTGTYSFVIDGDGLPSGAYTIQVRSENGRRSYPVRVVR